MTSPLSRFLETAKSIACFTGLLCLLSFVAATAQAQAQPGDSLYYLLVGSYTENDQEGKGIYVFTFNASTGSIKPLHITEGIANPSFLTASENGNFVYAVQELSEQGSVRAYSFDKTTGQLVFLNTQSTKGGDPCYLSISPTGKQLFVANYSGGSLAALPILPDGSLSPVSQHIQHRGKSKHEQRQEAPHLHAVVPGPHARYLYAIDLGTDRVHTYPFNGQGRQPLQVQEAGIYQVLAGNGPRHIIFNKAGTQAYLMLELSGQVAVYSVGEKGQLVPLQTVSLVSSDFKGQVSGAELKLSPDERFLYASNRGDANELSCFSVAEDGHLKPVSRSATRGKTPRNFMIDPSGNFLLVANQESNSVVIFRRDKNSGKLTPTGQVAKVGAPVYLLLIKKAD